MLNLAMVYDGPHSTGSHRTRKIEEIMRRL